MKETNDRKPDPEISVAVSTHQRPRALPNLVAALERQTLPAHRFEVVIVDDASRDETFDVLRSLQEGSPIDLRIERLPENRGPATGRNVAWRSSRGEVIAFTDDDCQPAADWLERGLAAMSDEVGVLVGRTLPDPQQEDQRGPFSRTMHVTDSRYIPTCNVFYRRDDLEAVGGFDEGFPTPGGEDTDLGWRVSAERRRPVRFIEQALVYHDIRPSSFIAKVKETWRWIGVPRLVARHPRAGREQLYLRVFWKPSHPRVLLASLGIGLAPTFPYTILLTLPWLYMRVRREPLTWHRVRRFVVLPGAFAIDLLEVFVMVRGSVRYGTFVL